MSSIYSKLFARTASLNDEVFLFNLWNDPLTRRMMRSQKKVSFSDHSKWFSERIKKNDSPIFILIEGKENTDENKVGVVRFIDQKRQRYDVSIILNPCYRNKGLGTEVLRLAVIEMKKKLPECILFAMYKKTNLSVRKVFLNNGFLECTPSFECNKVQEFDLKTELFCIYNHTK